MLKVRVYNAELVEELLHELKVAYTDSMVRNKEAGNEERVRRNSAAITALGIFEDRLYDLETYKIDEDLMEES